MTTTTSSCPHCARLARRLDHVEAELAISRWVLLRLAERHGQPRLAGLMAALDAFSESESEADAEDADGEERAHPA